MLVDRTLLCISYISDLVVLSCFTFIWLKYCRYGVKTISVNQTTCSFVTKHAKGKEVKKTQFSENKIPFIILYNEWVVLSTIKIILLKHLNGLNKPSHIQVFYCYLFSAKERLLNPLIKTVT